MTEYGLFLDIGVVEQLQMMRLADRRRIFASMEKIRQRPGEFSGHSSRDSEGRLVHVHFTGRFAIKYWEDFADRHVKILDIRRASDSKGRA